MDSNMSRFEELLAHLQAAGLFRLLSRTDSGVTLEVDGAVVSLSNERACIFVQAAALVPNWYLPISRPGYGDFRDTRPPALRLARPPIRRS